MNSPASSPTSHLSFHDPTRKKGTESPRPTVLYAIEIERLHLYKKRDRRVKSVPCDALVRVSVSIV